MSGAATGSGVGPGRRGGRGARASGWVAALLVASVGAVARAEPAPPTASFDEPPAPTAPPSAAPSEERPSPSVPAPAPIAPAAAPSAAPPAASASAPIPPAPVLPPPAVAAASAPATVPAERAAAGPSVPAPGPRPLPESRYHDPHVDRGVLFPTAETQPRGTFLVTGYDFYLYRFGYAFTDWLQASVAALPPHSRSHRETVAFGDLSLKARLYRDRWVRVGATVGYAAASNYFARPRGYQHLRVGAMGTLCAEPTCQISVTPGLHGILPVVSDRDPFLVASLGAVGHVTRGFAFLFEPAYLVWFSEGRNDRGSLLSYGLRFHGERVAFDLTFARPLVEGGGDFFLLGMPLLALTVRTRGAEARAARGPRPRVGAPSPVHLPPGDPPIPGEWRH